MDELSAWRHLLGKIISNPVEKQRIAEAMRINEVTLTRWAAGKSKPRRDNLLPLLKAVPQYQYKSELFVSMREEFPDFFDKGEERASNFQEIPAPFYDRVLKARMLINQPLLRISSMSIMILLQVLEHFDLENRGLAVTLVQCMAPPRHKKVKSLHEIMGRSTPSWGKQVEKQLQFLGIESPVGHAATQGRGVVIHSLQQRKQLFPADKIDWIESEMAYPILFESRVAGCLRIMSVQPNFFSLQHQEIALSYSGLAALLFESHEFYDVQDLELGLMPDPHTQQEYMVRVQVQQRINQLMLQRQQATVQVQRQQIISRREAEQIVWRQIELELLGLYQAD